MKILALDIGGGTEDILLYDSAKNVENCVKMVLPAPSMVYAAKVRAATQLWQDLFIKGDVIGGGAFTSALMAHLKIGLHVVMTEKSAYTVRNDLDGVRKMGIEITFDDPPTCFHGKTLTLEEVNLTKLQTFLVDFIEPFSNLDIVAVAVQDHGVPPSGMSNRRFRIQKMRELLERNLQSEALLFREDEVPSCFLRMRSAVQAAKRQLPMAKVVVMDTAPAAIFGCFEDQNLEGATTVLAVNVGNNHTMAHLLEDNRIIGVLEHHTRLLNPQKIEHLLISFANGQLSNEDIFRDNGHGLFFLKEPPGFSKIDKVVITGPNRGLLSQTNLPCYFATPAGDVMMTGTIGLVAMTRKIFKSLKS